MFVTCGLWRFFWAYRTSEDLVRYNGDGLGGALSIALYFVAPVLMFTIPNEIEKMYQRDGRQSPVTDTVGAVVPAADHRQHHLVREGAAGAQRLLAEQGARPAEPDACLVPPVRDGWMMMTIAAGR